MMARDDDYGNDVDDDGDAGFLHLARSTMCFWFTAPLFAYVCRLMRLPPAISGDFLFFFFCRPRCFLIIE